MTTSGVQLFFTLIFLVHTNFASPDSWMHPSVKQKRSINFETHDDGAGTAWTKNAQEVLREKLHTRRNENIAKNVIFFLGDGMSIPTLAAARAYMGGTEKQLAFEKFPYTGLSKTYCNDFQVADSACSATAYLTGIKANLGTIGVTSAVKRFDCPSMRNATNHVHSLAYFAQLRGKHTGLVTTSRVTHASPAGIYAHTADRDWESDTDVLRAKNDPIACQDIASQLVNSDVGRQLNVVMGGGRVNFLPRNRTNEHGHQGNRTDNEDLIQQWLNQKRLPNHVAKYVYNRSELLDVDTENVTHLLGLFNADHINYNLIRNTTVEPSLEEMTRVAIEILKQCKQGYFLFVEGARIDMAHHQGQARRAMDETLELSKAVQLAVELTSDDDTLIVVTSDHAHTMSMSGYAQRDDNILGVGGTAQDAIPYTILNYANGPGFRPAGENGQRYDVTKDDSTNVDYRFPGVFPMFSATHGGDDVAIFAKGPWAHLFTGVIEQNVIPHLVSWASCMGRWDTFCDYVENIVLQYLGTNKEKESNS